MSTSGELSESKASPCVQQVLQTDYPHIGTLIEMLNPPDDELQLYRFYEMAKARIMPLVPNMPGAHQAVAQALIDKIGI